VKGVCVSVIVLRTAGQIKVVEGAWASESDFSKFCASLGSSGYKPQLLSGERSTFTCG